MITRITHTSIYVRDQDEALRFYHQILGMEVRADIHQNGFRWLTVGPKAQPEFELVLMPISSNRELPSESAKTLQHLIEQGAIGIGVFCTDDAMRDYREWSQKGVEFVEPPSEQFYGIGAKVKDPSGNWFSLLQPKK